MIGTNSALYNWKIIEIDTLVLVLVYFIPTLAHLSPFPLYYLDPMRLLLFSVYLASRNTANAYLMAFTIPLFSALVTGHPPFYKALLISVELLINIGGIHFLINKTKWHIGILVFVSTILSKLVYYCCKFVFIKIALIDGNLISTSPLIQLVIIVVLSVLFSIFYKKLQSEKFS